MVLAAVRVSFMVIMIAGTRAASALRASAAAGPACAASPGLIVGGAGSAAGDPRRARAGLRRSLLLGDVGRVA